MFTTQNVANREIFSYRIMFDFILTCEQKDSEKSESTFNAEFRFMSKL